MIPKDKVVELAQAHSALTEPTTGAIWIRSEAPEAWLVEVIPSLADDKKADEPTYFNPGVSFRFPLALIAGNRRSLETALRRKRTLAKEIATGTVVLDQRDSKWLVNLARRIVKQA